VSRPIPTPTAVNYDRCISTGVLNSITPKIYNSGSRIVQGPGWLAFSNEMITRRVHPDRRPQAGGLQNQDVDGHVGWHWKGTSSVVETRTSSPSRSSTASPLGRGRADRTVHAGRTDTLDYRMTIKIRRSTPRRLRSRFRSRAKRATASTNTRATRGTTSMKNLLSGSRAEDKRRARRWRAVRRFRRYVEPARAAGRPRRRSCRRRWPRSGRKLAHGCLNAARAGCFRPASSRFASVDVFRCHLQRNRCRAKVHSTLERKTVARADRNAAGALTATATGCTARLEREPRRAGRK